MAEVIYIKIDCRLDSVSSVKAKIAKLDAILESLFTTALVSVEAGNIAEYEFDSGQTRNQVTYSKVTDVTSAIEKYEKLRTFYWNKLMPKSVRLVDSSNFRR